MTPSPDPTRNSETWSAIQAFEQILDAFPDDLNTLEALFQAYESLDENDKAGVYILRAGRVAVQQTGISVSPVLADRLKRLAPAVREAAQIVSKLGEERLRAALTVSPPAEAGPTEEKLRNPAAAELDMAWDLKEAGLLTDSEYSEAVRQLSEGISSTGRNSLLALIQSMQMGDFEKIMAHMARDSGMAILPVSNFETPLAVSSLLSPDFMTVRGAVVFEMIGQELLVAVLNSRDTHLRKEVEQLCGRTCHFFLTPPSEMDVWLKRARDPKRTT